MAKLRVLSENDKAAMRARYANLTPDERKAEGDRMQELRRSHRAKKRSNHAVDEESRRAVFLAHIDAVETAWAAGFWEGEGSVGKRHFQASQKTRWPLERLMASFGGRLSKDKREDGCWQWFVCGEQGRAFGMAIMRHLSPRRIEQINRKFLWRPSVAMPSHYKPILSVVKKVADATDS